MTICRFVADTKNSIGLAGCIEEVAHNAIAVYWNPLESAAKVYCTCPFMNFYLLIETYSSKHIKILFSKIFFIFYLFINKYMCTSRFL